MGISTALVGCRVPPMPARTSERWLMAYAASIGRLDDCYLDTARPEGIRAHPLFPVCLEWPVLLELGREVRRRGLEPSPPTAAIHATHDLRLSRLLRADEELATSCEVVGMVAVRPGVLMTTELTTTDATGAVVASTTQGTLYLGQELNGAAVPPPAGALECTAPFLPTGSVPLEIGGGAAHLYTEGAQIYNPIHTSRRVALEAGLDGLLLHGTATLAMATSAVVEELGAAPDAVARVVTRFSGPVAMPSRLEVRFDQGQQGDEGRIIRFEVIGAGGKAVLTAGAVVLRR